jgi:hypothetical protein
VPFIPQDKREKVDSYLNHIAWEELDEGGLAYVLYYSIIRYLATRPIRYHVLAGVLGTIDTVSALIVSEKLLPYEKSKEVENGGIE